VPDTDPSRKRLAEPGLRVEPLFRGEPLMPEVHIYLAEGRSVEQKKKLMKALSDAVVSTIGVDANVVTVQIMEAPNTDKMKGGVTFA
jgi:4-oxalocrotonate tautomerase